MRGLGYIDDPNWVSDYIGFTQSFNISLEVCTHSNDIAERIRDYFNKVYVIGGGNYYPDLLMKFLEKAASDYDLILSPSTLKGRLFSGYASYILKVPAYTDVIKIDFKDQIVERLVYGGMAKASIKASPPYIINLVKGVYKGEAKKIGGEIEILDLGESRLEVEFEHRVLEGVDPTKADIVIGAGRGFRSKDDLKMVDELAKLLGGAWSVTRPLAADYGWCEHWIGISGLVINPKIYLIIGSSGQPHHMLGARGSKIIIAINKDREAPVFEEADYGLIGDLYKILPKLLDRIRELQGDE